MKKLFKLMVTALFVATLAIPALASNYVNVPDYSTPDNKAATVDGNYVRSVLASDKDVITIYVSADSKITEDAMLALSKTVKTLVFVADGYTVSINGKDIETPKALNLKMAVATEGNVLTITPSQKGDFFAKIKVTVPQSVLPANYNKATGKVYYVADNGVKTDLGTPIWNYDVTISIVINHASHYEITSTSTGTTTPDPVNPTDPTNPPTNPSNPNTGDSSALPLAVGLFVVASAFVVFMKNKKTAA